MITNIKNIDTILDIFKKSIQLLSVGLISSAGLMFLSSGRWQGIPTEAATKILVFIQWEILGLTIAKVGMDQYLYAQAVNDTGKSFSFDFSKTYKTTILLIIMFSTLLIGKLNVFEIFLMSIVIFFDVYSVITISIFNGSQNIFKSTIANFLNYPIFFFFILVSQCFIETTYNLLLYFFVSSSLCRLVYLKYQNNFFSNPLKIDLNAVGILLISIQQILNFILFKIDQYLVLYLDYFVGKVDKPEFLQQSLFLFRAVDIVTAMLVGLSPVYMPFLIGRKAERYKRYHFVLLYFILSVFATLVIEIYAQHIWANKTVIRSQMLIPIILNILLILPTNAITLNLFKSHVAVRKIIATQFSAIGLSVLICFLLLSRYSMPEIILYVVPLQMCIYCLVGYWQLFKRINW